MGAIANDLYFNVLKPVLPYFIWPVWVWFIFYISGENLRTFVRESIVEIRDTALGIKSLKSLNALGILVSAALVAILANGYSMPGSSSDEQASLQLGASLIYFAIFSLAFILCVRLTKYERK